MYNNFSSKKTKKVISALLASALVVTSGPITADAATAKVVGIKKSITVSASATNKVTGLSKAEKKIVKVTKKGKKFTIKGLKAGKATFKIGKKSYTVKVGATAVKTAKAKLTLTKGKAATVKFTATAGNGDTVAFASSNKNVTLSKKSAKIAKNVASVKVTAKKAGTAKITATSKATGKKATVTVTVKNPAPVATTPGTSNTPSVTTGAATNTPEATATTEATTTPEVTATPVATATGSATATPEVTNTPEVTSGAATATPEVTNTPEVTSGAATATPEVTATPTATPETVTLAAVTASAISTNKIAVEFNKTVTASAIKADDVVVTENSERRFVKSVTADAKNDKVLVVEFYDNLTSGKTYNLALTIEGKTFAMNVAYTQGAASKIVVADQTIPAGDATALKYTVLDANGLDITDATNVTFTSDKQDAISDGKVTLTDKATAFVKITCTVTNGTTVTTVTSDQFTVRAEAKVAKTLANYTTAVDEPNFAATDYKQDLNVLEDQTNAKLYVQLKDQFQADFTGTTTFESLDTSVAVVDKTTGLITPIKVGTAPVKITNGAFTQTIMISVVAKSTIQKIVVKDNALTIYPGLTNKTARTNVKLEDQYGKASYTGLTATIKAGEDLVTVDSCRLATDGTLSVTAKAIDKTGTAVIEVSNGTFKQNIAVSLVALGTVVGYDVSGVKPTLDRNTSADSKDSNYKADEMTFTVNPVDKAGKIAGDPANFTYTVKSGTDVIIAETGAADTATIKIGTDNIEANKTYTVTVKVGNMEVKTFQFNTIDTRKAPTVIVAKQSATITETAAKAITNKDELAAALQTAKVLSVDDGCTLKNLDFVTTDSTAITSKGEVKKDDGTIVLKSVDVADAKGDIYTVKLSGNLTIKVVAGVAAGEPTVVEGVTAVEGSNQVVTVTVGKDVTGTVQGDKILGVDVSGITNETSASGVATAIVEKFANNTTWTAGPIETAGPINTSIPIGSPSEAVITFTAKEKAADVDLTETNMAGTTIASSPAADKISYKNTISGIAPVEGKKASYTTTIVTNNVAGTAKVTVGRAHNVEVTVASTDSAETIATKIAAALNANTTFNTTYKASNNGSSLTIEQNTAGDTSDFANELGFGLTF